MCKILVPGYVRQIIAVWIRTVSRGVVVGNTKYGIVRGDVGFLSQSNVEIVSIVSWYVLGKLYSRSLL